MRNLLFSLALMLTALSVTVPVQAEDDVTYETAYFDISPDIVSNVQGRAKYIRTHIQLETNRADLLYLLETHAPLFRHVLLMTLVDQKGEDIQSPKGKEKLRNKLRDALSKALDEKIDEQGIITDLYFTTYYVK